MSSSLPSVPPGSGDYSVVLAHAARYKKGETTFDKLTEAIVARKLRVHSLGDAYLLTPAPMPPPGIAFDPKMMPKDWEGTFGEVAMAYWLGELTRDEYDRLHRAAHPACPK